MGAMRWTGVNESYESAAITAIQKRPLIIRRRVWCNLFCIPVLVQGSQMYEWAFRVGILPVIEFHDDAMHGKEQIVIRLLKCIGNGITYEIGVLISS